jgi:Ala-tRNA(Pro) deacylase
MSATRQVGAEQGDVIVVGGRRVGEAARRGEVLEVLGSEDRPHYAVRWDDGHQSILYPGDTTSIERRHADDRPAPQLDVPGATRVLVERLREALFEFELLPHRRTLTAASEARVLGVLPQTVAKTLIARDEEGVHIRAVVPASSRVSIPKLAEAVSATSVAVLTEEELVSAYPQFELGAVPPFGGPAGDLVVVDRSLVDNDHVVFDGGVHDTSLRMRTADLIVMAHAATADIVEH